MIATFGSVFAGETGVPLRLCTGCTALSWNRSSDECWVTATPRKTCCKKPLQRFDAELFQRDGQPFPIFLTGLKSGDWFAIETAFAGQNVGVVRSRAEVCTSGEKIAAGKVDYPLAKDVCEVLQNFAAHTREHTAVCA